MLLSSSRLAGWLYITSLGLLAAPSALLAQVQVRPAPIMGSVRGTTGTGLEHATVTLHRATDSVAVKTEFGDAEGRFQLEPAVNGQYLVSAAQVGYGRKWFGPLNVTAAPNPVLEFRVEASTNTVLQGVTVTAQRPVFERLPDRTIVNVEGSILSSGNTLLDVLGQAPGVSIDVNDNLALRGKQGLLVLIDGKRQPMTGSELANYLRALPADQVKSIELITNPPAKYDAQGGAGIIAINLKKDQREGTNGTFNTAYGRGRYGKYTTGLTLNHRVKKLSLNSSYAYANRQNFQELDLSRSYRQENGLPDFFSVQRNTSRSQLQSHTWRAGADYAISSRTTLGAMVSGLASQLPSKGLNEATVLNAQQQLVARYTSVNHRELHTPNVAANVTLRHLFPKDSLGTAELTFDADVARYGLTRLLHLDTRFDYPPTLPPSLLTGDQDGTLTIWSAKTDYVRPLRHRMRLEAGAKVSQVNSDNDVLFERTQDGITSVLTGLTNRFRYAENINAGYISLTRSRPQLTITAGLRGEHTHVRGRQDMGQYATIRRNYFQLFPSLSIRRPLAANHELAFSLGRRLDRPTYNQLNPFRSYVDATSYRTGNPTLWPQTSTNAELTHTFRQKFSTALSYTRTNRPIVNVYLLDANALVVATDINLRTQEYFGLSLTAPVDVTKWWKLYANTELFYIRFQGELVGTQPPQSRPGAIVSLNNTLTFAKGWSADVNGNYHTPERYAFQDIRSFGQLGLGIQKSYKSATVRLNAADIFYTTPLRVTSRYLVLEESFRAAQDSRVMTASLSYRFGNDKVAAARRRATSAEDEKRRASQNQP